MTTGVKAGPEWPARRAKARATRAAIIEAAADLFVGEGYLGTSVQAIADRAGVSRATVFNSVGGKLELLRAAFDVATVGDDEPVPLPQRPQARAVRAEPDPRKAVAGYAAMVTGVSSRVAGIYEAFRCAAGVDPRARVQWAQIQEERRGGARAYSSRLLKDYSVQRRSEWIIGLPHPGGEGGTQTRQLPGGAGLACQITELLRIGLQIVELVHVAGTVDVLPATVGNHARVRLRIGQVAGRRLAEDGRLPARRRAATEHRCQTAALEGRRAGNGRHAG